MLTYDQIRRALASRKSAAFEWLAGYLEANAPVIAVHPDWTATQRLTLACQAHHTPLTAWWEDGYAIKRYLRDVNMEDANIPIVTVGGYESAEEGGDGILYSYDCVQCGRIEMPQENWSVDYE